MTHPTGRKEDAERPDKAGLGAEVTDKKPAPPKSPDADKETIARSGRKEDGAEVRAKAFKDLAPWIDDNVGVSSTALFLYMSRGDVPRAFDAPSDYGDRERCISLLTAVPEWIPRLKEIEDLHLAGTRYSSEHPAGAMVETWNEAIPLIREEMGPPTTKISTTDV